MARHVERFQVFDARSSIPRPPVLVHTASTEGLVVIITANVHGDELTSVAAIYELDSWLPHHLVSGKVVLLPTCNPAGLVAASRNVGSQGGDLNRSFPGDAHGTPSERAAHQVWTEIESRRPQLVIDLHSDSEDAVPYVIVDRPILVPEPQRTRVFQQAEQYAHASGLLVLRDYPEEIYRRYALDRSLAGAVLNRLRIPAITIEAGPRRVIRETAVADMVLAVRGILAEAGVISIPSFPHGSRASGGPYTRTIAVRAESEGWLVPSISPGTRFGCGDRIARVRTLSGDWIEEIIAPVDGVVVAWTDHRWVAPGGSVGTFGFIE